MTLRVKLSQDLLHNLFVTELRSAYKIVVRQFQFRRKLFPYYRQFVTVGLGRFPLRQGGLLHLLAVFIQTRQKEYFLAQAAARARNNIGDHFFISMAKMGMAVDVIDGGGDIETFAHRPLLWRRGGVLAIPWGRQNRPKIIRQIYDCPLDYGVSFLWTS